MNFFPHAKSAKAAKLTSKPLSHPAPIRLGFPTFIPSHLSTIQHQKFKIQNFRTTPLTPSSLNPLIPRRLSAAFSLTEVVIAMGVAAVAFTSLIALFPLGLNLNNESYMETQASILAKTILEDLRDTQNGDKWARGGRPADSRLLQISTDANPETASPTFTAIPLNSYAGSYTNFLAYTNAVISDAYGNRVMCRPTKIITANDYSNGVVGAAAVAKITLNQLFDNLHRVEVVVEVPGTAKETNRTRQFFSGVIR